MQYADPNLVSVTYTSVNFNRNKFIEKNENVADLPSLATFS